MTDYTAGILWALLSALFFSVSAVLISIYLRRMGVMAASFVTNIVNAAVLVVIGWARYDASLLSLEGFIWFGILGVTALEEDIVRQTLGVLLKYQDDIEKIDGDELRRLLDAAA